MEEQDSVDPDYLKGFNEGYMISRHAPELAEKLSTLDADTPRISGFKDGRQQLLAEKEVNKHILPQWLRGFNQRAAPAPDKPKDRGRESDKDDY